MIYNSTNITKELKITSVVERFGQSFKPTDGKIWKSPMQEITTSDGVFIDNQPGVSLGWGTWPGHDWKNEVGNTVVAELLEISGYTWIKFIKRIVADKEINIKSITTNEISTEERKLTMVLQAMYENAPKGYKTATLIHFGKISAEMFIELQQLNGRFSKSTSKRELGIDFPLLSTSNASARYYKDPLFIRGERFIYAASGTKLTQMMIGHLC